MPRIKTPANVVGPQVKRFRQALGLTQEQVAVRCQLVGLDLSRGTFSHVEARLRCVTDHELFLLATVLNVTTEDLYPPELKRRRERYIRTAVRADGHQGRK